MAKSNNGTGTPSSSVPESNYNRADQIALGLYTQRETRGTIVNPGLSSSLNIDTMRAELGDDFQLHKGEKYLVESYNTKMTKKLYEDAKRKADEQGFWGELAGFAAQAVGKEIILGTLEGVGYLLDFDHWVDKLSGGEGDWGNWLSDLSQEGQKWIEEKAPIHKDPNAGGRGFWQNAMYTDGWWASNGVSVASALSLLIPVAGWARGAGMVGKGINVLGKMGRTGAFGTTGIKSMNLVDDLIKTLPAASKSSRVIADGVHKAIVSRHLENHMEAASVYQEQYEKYKAQGMSDAQAKEAAGEGASFAYKAGWAMLLTDIPQYLMLGRSFNASKAILNQKVAKAANQSLYKTATLNLGEYAKQFAAEGFEEAYQFVVSEEGKYHADVVAGLVDPKATSIADRLGKYTEDAELWTAAFFGGFGGVAFQALGNPTTEFINKKLFSKGEAIITQNDMRLQEIMNRKQVFSSNVKSYFEAVEANDERALEAAKGRIGFDLGVMAAKVGNWSLAKSSMEQLKNATPEEKAAFGFGDSEEFNTNIDRYIKDAEGAVKLYSKNAVKYEASTVEAITYREYMINQYSKKLPNVRRNVETLKQQIPLINDLSVNGKAAFEAKLELKAQERYIKAAKWKLDKMSMPEDEKINLQKNIELAESAVSQYKETINQHIKEGLTTTEQVTLNSLDGAVSEDLSKAKAEVQWIEHYLGQYSDEVNKMTSSDFQNTIRTKEDAEAEKAKRNVKASKKAEQIQKDKDKLNGVLHPEDSELSQTYAGSEVETSLEDLDNKINKGEVPWDSLDKKAKEEILKYRETKSKTNENPDISDTEIEQFGLDLSTLEKRDAAGDYQKQDNNATEHVEFESPKNPESEPDWRSGDDIAQGNITTLHTALAWLSPNNSWAREEFKTDANKALAAFLEGQNSLNGIEIVFDVNEVWLNSSQNRGVRGYKNIRESLAAKRMPEDIGFVPISGTLYRDGKPLEYAGQLLTLSLHDKDFYLEADTKGNFTIPKTEHSEAQVAILETHKREILEAYFTGNKLKAKITGKTGGNINIVEGKNGEFAKIPVSDTLGQIKNVELVYGNSHKGYVNAEGNLVADLFQYQTGTNGAIYAVTKTANGTPFPLRLQIDNLNRNEASIIYKIYTDLLTNDKLFSQPISDILKKSIETSNDPRIKGLENYLNLSKTTYRDLLMNLVYEGKKTEAKEESRLFTYPKNDKTGQPAIIAFGKNQYDLKMLTSAEGREKFIEHLVKHRRRQINVKLLNNIKYKEYLESNKIITTNVAATPTKNLFVQPTVSYSEELESVTQDRSYVEAAIEGIKTDLEYEKTSEFGSPEIAKALEEQLEKLTKKETSIEQPEAPKGTKDGNVDIEINFNEDNAFDLSKIFPNPDIKKVDVDSRDQIAEYNADEAKDAKKKKRSARLKRADDKKDKGETGAFKRFRPLPNSQSFINIQDEAAHIQSLLPEEIGIRLTPGYVHVLSQGNVAIGMFKNGMITLSEQAPRGTAYHEAFHAVFRTLTTYSEQTRLIEQAKRAFEKPQEDELKALMKDHSVSKEEAEVLFYEEVLADEFADYMENPELAEAKHKYPGGVKRFFQKILNWINEVFRNRITIAKLFDNINKGKYRTKTPLITRSVAFRAHPIFTANQVREITQQLAYAAFSKVTYLQDVKQNFNAKLIEDTLDNAYREAQEMNNAIGEEIMDRIDLLSNDKGELDIFWIKKIEEYIKVNFDLKKVDKIDDYSDIDEENIDTQEMSNFMKSSYEISGKDNATSTVKFIIAMTPQIEEYVNGQPIYKKSSLLGLPMFNDFGSTYNAIEKSLAGIVSTMEGGVQQDSLSLMRKKLEEDFKYKPELKFVLDKLSSMDEAVQTQFHYTFSRQRGNYIDHLLEGTAGNIDSKIGSSDIESKERTIRDSWASQFSQNFGMYGPEGEFTYNPEVISLFKATRDNFKGLLNRDIISKAPIGVDTMKALGQTLQLLGVTLSPKAFNKIIDSYMAPQKDPILRAQFSLRNFEIDLTNATNNLLKKQGPLNEKTNLLLDEDSFFKNLLARTEADFRKIGGESSFLGPDGNQYYIYQDNNLISKTIAQFKSGDLSHLEKLKASDYGSHSLWLNALLNDEKAREVFGTALYGNLKKISNTDRGDKASDLKPADQFIDVFNKYLHGVFIGLAEADKSQQTYFIGPEVQSAGVSFAPAQGKVFFNNEKPRSARILMGYLADELMRMETARKAYYGYTDVTTGEKYPALPENEQILYYHYNLDGKGNRIPGNALNSFLFPDINLEALGLRDPETGEIYPLTAEGFDNNKELWEYIKTTFLNAVQKDLREAVEFGLIAREGQGYINKGIANKHLKDRQGDIVSAVADYTLNSIIANVEQTKIFNGDPALYKVKLKFEADGTTLKPWATQPLFVDFMKRIPAAGAAGKDFRIFNEPDGTVAVRSKYISATIANIDKISSSFFGTEDGKFNEESIDLIAKNTGLSRASIKGLFAPYLKVNQTDAQAWITLDAYKERMRGLGKWTSGHEEAYTKSVSGDTLTLRDIKLLAQPLKTVHAELLSTTGNVMSMQYNKQSEAVLLPSLTRGIELDKLRLAMEDQQIDHVIVLDGKKVGAMGIAKIATQQGQLFDTKDIKLNGIALSYNNLFLQQDLPSKGMKPTLVGSQGAKNVLSVIDIEATYLDELTGRELINEYHRAKSALSDEGLKGFKKKVKYNDETGELERDENGVLIYNQLLQTEFTGEISDNHMDSLATDVDLDALPIKDKIQNKGNAMLTKSTVKLKQLGAALIQMSDFGFVGSEINLSAKVKDGIIWFKDPREKLKPMHITAEGVQPAQILIPWTQGEKIQRILKKHNIKLEDLTHEQIKAMIDPEVLKGLSYRIPNQGPSSNDAFEIVGILPPQVGDTMIAYSAITTKTGSDFDIDKSFIILPNFFFNEKSGKIEKVPYNRETETKEGLENYVVDMMRSMLMHPNSFASVMTPLDDPWLEDSAKEMYPELIDSAPLDFFTGTTQLKNKMTFDNAKNLVGVIANHMTHHALALSEGLYFNNYYLGKGIKSETNNSIISNKFDEEGNRIESTLGAFMNAIVDAAKDPYISRANINQVTANTAFMLVRAGVSREWIVAFMGQPILKEYVKQMSLREGRFAESIVEGGVVLKPLDLTLRSFNSGLSSSDLYQAEYSLQGSEGGDITLSLDQLKKGFTGTDVELQEKILAQFLQWQKKAKALNDVIRVCKADVNGATRNLTRAKLANNLLEKVVQENQIGNVDKLLGFTVIDDEIVFNEGRMTGTYFKNSVLASREIFKGLFMSTTGAAENTLDSITAAAGYLYLEPTEEHELLADKVNNEIYALTASDTDAFRETSEGLRTLLFGTPGKVEYGEVIPRQFSIANRVNQAKSGPLKENLLIASLETRPSYGTTPAKVYLPNNETTKMVKDDLYLAWLELFELDRALADDLMKYAFYASGFSRTIGNFYEHIPMEKLTEYRYSEQIKAKKLEYSDEYALQEKQDLIFKNLYKDNKLVPVVSKNHIYQVRTNDGKKLDTEHIFILVEGDGENYVAGMDSDGEVVFKKFLKMENPIFDNMGELIGTSINLYQLQGYTTKRGAIYVRTNKLGYNNKGNVIKEYMGDGKSSIFAENNVTLPKEIFSYLNGLEPSKIPTMPYDRTNKKKKISDNNREHRLDFCINTQ